MKPKTFILLCLGGLAVTGPGSLAAQSSSPTVEEQLSKIEHDWSDSYIKRDASFAQRITADDFIFVTPDGSMVNKVDYVKNVTGPTILTSFKMESLKVRVYGDTAVVTGVAAIAGKTGSKDESDRFAFTDTFVKQNGDWKAVSGQATTLKNPSNP